MAAHKLHVEKIRIEGESPAWEAHPNAIKNPDFERVSPGEAAKSPAMGN